MSQTPDQLKELGRIFTAVGNGAQWQFASRTRPETWHEPEPGFSPLRAAEIGYLLRVVPWALPSPPEGREWHRGAEFTEADLPEGYRPMLVGERACDGDEAWLDGAWRHTRVMREGNGVPLKHRTRRPVPEPDRVKPDPVQIGPEDVPPMSALRNLRRYPNTAWVNFTCVNSSGVCMGDTARSYAQLMSEGWEIQRPGEDWKPCSKEPS